MMLQQRIYTKIYFAYNEYKRIELLFYNETNSTALHFDGFDFIYKAFLIDVAEFFKELEYSIQQEKDFFEIEDIRQDDLLNKTYVGLSNGDIFQIYSVMDDENAGQILSIFEKNIGVSGSAFEQEIYKEAVERLKKAEECKVYLNNSPMPED